MKTKFVWMTMAAAVMSTVMMAAAQEQAPVMPAGILPIADVERAIAKGTKAKGDMQGLLLTDQGAGWANAMGAMSASMSGTSYRAGSSGFSVRVYTPVTWVAQQASDAAKRYKTYTPADVTADDVAPVLRVVVYPDKPAYLTGGDLAATKIAEHVVISDPKRKTVIQPIAITPFEETTSSALRDMKFVGLIATFDLRQLDALRANDKDHEFQAVIVQSHGERPFTVKKKHFDRIPYQLPAAAAVVTAQP